MRQIDLTTSQTIINWNDIDINTTKYNWHEKRESEKKKISKCRNPFLCVSFLYEYNGRHVFWKVYSMHKDPFMPLSM